MWRSAELQETGTGGDAWWHPRSDKLLRGRDIPGNAPGLNPEGSLPGGNTHFIRPCHCGIGLSSPHEWVPGQCENDKHPLAQHEAATTENWVYLEGHVGFGRNWWEIVRDLAVELEYDETTQKYISNLIARNALPQDLDVAVGMIRGGKPQIFASSVDRNAVYDAVAAAHDSEEAPAGPLDLSQWL